MNRTRTRNPLRLLALVCAAAALLIVPAVALAQSSGGALASPLPGMDAQAVLTVGAAVVALTQMVKWAGLPDKAGPLAVMVLALIGVAVWAYQQGGVERSQAFAYFAGWISVALTAAGVFGFTRAGVSAVTSAKPPPAGGAGSSPTVS